MESQKTDSTSARLRFARLPVLLGLGFVVIAAAVVFRRTPWVHELQMKQLPARSLAMLALEHPDDARVFRELGARLSEQKDLPGSLAAYRRAVELNPRDYDSQMALGMGLVAVERPYDAERCWVEAAKLRPKSPDPHFLLANLYDTYRNKSSTIGPLETVTRIDPRNAEAWYRLGDALEELHQYDRALPAFEKAAELAPDRTGYLRDLAQIQMHYGKTAEARATLERALTLPEPDPGVLVLLAKLDLDEGVPAEQLRSAEDRLRQALQLDARFAPAYRELGTLYTRRGEHQRAAAALRTAVAIDPSDGPSLFALGRALIRSGKREEGEKYVKGFQALSEARRSVKVLEDRIHQDPKNAELRLRIARLYRRYGDDDRGLNQYQVYLSMKPDPAVAQELEAYRKGLGRNREAGSP